MSKHKVVVKKCTGAEIIVNESNPQNLPTVFKRAEAKIIV